MFFSIVFLEIFENEKILECWDYIAHSLQYLHLDFLLLQLNTLFRIFSNITTDYKSSSFE